MRFSVLIPILLSVAAFVLAILVVLAGSNTNFLTDAYIIKLDTSNIGNGNINIPGIGIPIIDNFIDNTPKEVIDQVVQTAARALGIHDFYTAQVMGYCEGMGGNGHAEVVTNCTSKPLFIFDPVHIIQEELRIAGGNITLKDLGFPTEDIDNAVRALNAVYQIMFVAYCIGITAAGICILLGFLGFLPSRLVACVNWLIAFISFLALGIASVIGNLLAIKMRDIINSKLADIGVTASYSQMYLAMTWSAAGAMLFVSIYWCCTCCTSRREKHSDPKQPVGYEGSLVEEKPTESKQWRGFR